MKSKLIIIAMKKMEKKIVQNISLSFKVELSLALIPYFCNTIKCHVYIIVYILKLFCLL